MMPVLKRDFKVWFSALIIMLALLLFNYVLVQKIRQQSSEKQNLIEIFAAENDIIYRSLNDKKQELAAAEAIIIENTKTISNQIEKIGQLESVVNETKFATITKIERIDVPVFDTIYVDQQDTIFAQSIQFNDQWTKLKATLHKDIFTINTLEIKNDYHIQTGYEKSGLFRKKPMVYIQNLNPYSTTESAQSIHFKEEKKIVKNPIVYGAIGLITGILIRR